MPNNAPSVEDKVNVLQAVMVVAKLWNFLGQNDEKTIAFLMEKGAEKEMAEHLLNLSKHFHTSVATPSR